MSFYWLPPAKLAFGWRRKSRRPALRPSRSSCCQSAGMSPDTGQYRCAPDRDKVKGYSTVIIDEASMLTEEQLAAVVDGLAGDSG